MTGAVRPRRGKSVSWKTKLIVTLRAFGLTIEQIEFDHYPRLESRKWDPKTRDTVPSADDPIFLQMLRVEDHKRKTFGPGAEKRITTAGGDIHSIAHTRRLTKKQEEFRRAVTKKKPGRRRKKQSAMPSRKFSKRRKAR